MKNYEADLYNGDRMMPVRSQRIYKAAQAVLAAHDDVRAAISNGSTANAEQLVLDAAIESLRKETV